ncbi:MAG: pre-16S rRNA-processing nuclease YqgF [Gammaproteobacteria bacterium]|nr:pre-16S rRNA-processing nuclease YqgF [Gammaproteobacteria bacterium]
MNCLGLDCGVKKTGIALGSTITRTARPLDCIAMQVNQVELLLPFVQKWQIELIVFGDPGDRPENKALLNHIVCVKKKLHNLLPSCQIVDWSEQWTSQEARSMMRDFPRLQKQYATDAIAAMLMLQSYLESCV